MYLYVVCLENTLRQWQVLLFFDVWGHSEID